MLNTGSCSDKKFHQTMLLILAVFYLFVYILPLGLRDMMIALLENRQFPSLLGFRLLLLESRRLQRLYVGLF